MGFYDGESGNGDHVNLGLFGGANKEGIVYQEVGGRKKNRLGMSY